MLVVRIRPNEITLGNPKDYREIYDTSSKYDKTAFFKIFTLYGEDNLFSTIKYSDHRLKRRKIASAYSKSNVVANAEHMVRERIGALIEKMTAAPDGLVDFFTLFGCSSHDVMSRILFGPSHGSNALHEPKDLPVVIQVQRSQKWTPVVVNLAWLHGSRLMRWYLGDAYSKTIEVSEEPKIALEQLMLEHDNDPRRDEEASLYRHETGEERKRPYVEELYGV